MKKLTFSNGERTVIHYTNHFDIKEGVVRFYANGIETLDNYCCIDEEYLIKVKETIYTITKETTQKLSNGEFREYANCNTIFESESLEEAKKNFAALNGCGMIEHKADCKVNVLYNEYCLTENEVDEDGDFVGYAEFLAIKLIEC